MKRQAFWAWLAVVVALGACGAEPAARTGTGNNPGAAGGAGTAGAAAAGGGAAGNASYGNPGGATGAGTDGGAQAGSGGGGLDPTQCGGTTVEPKSVEVEVSVTVTQAEPVAIYIMLDNSGSMSAIWPGAMQAITDFVNDPKSAGLDVAFSVFPGLSAGCDATVYETPSVPMGRLPAHAADVIAGLPVFPFGSGTNIEPALRGVTEFCKKWHAPDPKDAAEKCVVLFVTDGDPNACSVDKNALAQIAGDAYTSAGVRTFTIALAGAQPAFLDDIATRGGGDCDPASATSTCDLTKGASFASALESVRSTITTVQTHTELQKQALPCEWGIPDPKPGETFDKDLVNVSFTAAVGGSAQTFQKVASKSECGSRASAWYYDDPKTPAHILACPASCDAVKAATDGRVDVVLGCPTVLVL